MSGTTVDALPAARSAPRAGWPRLAPPLALILLPIAVHLAPLLHWLSANPIYLVAQLAPWREGLLHGLPGWIDTNAGNTVQALGGLVARDWLSGTLPWWNPYSGVGMPLAAEQQNLAFFLPFVLLLRAFDGVLYLKIAMQILAGLGCFALLRQLGLRRFAAFLGAALFELNGTFAWLSDAPIMPVPFLPLLLLGIERAREAALARRGAGWRLIAVALAWSLFAGFPETAFNDGLLAALWALFRFIVLPGARLSFARRVLAGGTCGLLLAAPMIVSFLGFLPVAYLGFHGRAGSLGLEPMNLASLVFPLFYGPIIAFDPPRLWGVLGGYFGASMSFLAILALCVAPRDGRRMVLGTWLIVTLALSIDLPVVHTTWSLVPLIRQTWFFRYVVPSWCLCGAMLSAFAFEDWRDGAIRRSRLLLAVLIMLGLGAIVVAGAAPELRYMAAVSQSLLRWPVLSVGAALAVVGALAGLLALRPTRPLAALAGALVLVEAVALFAAPLLTGHRNKPSDIDWGGLAFLRSHLGLGRFYTFGPIAPNYGALFGLAAINHEYLPVPELWTRYIASSLDPGADLVSFTGRNPFAADSQSNVEALRKALPAYAALGVRYLVTPPNVGNPLGGGAPAVYASPIMNIYELPGAAPYFTVTGGPCRLFPQSRLRVSVACEAPATLIRHELFFPGWSATIGREPAPITQSGPLFQQIALPAGAATVRFRYLPPYMVPAFLAFLLGCVGLVVQEGRSSFLKKRSKRLLFVLGGPKSPENE